jgi:hypothetical protein
MRAIRRTCLGPLEMMFTPTLTLYHTGQDFLRLAVGLYHCSLIDYKLKQVEAMILSS